MPNAFSSISLLLIAGEISASPQVWAVVFHEAPGYYHRGTTFSSPAQLSALDGIFNYTVSYRSALPTSLLILPRKDADFPHSYFQQGGKECYWKKTKVTHQPRRLQSCVVYPCRLSILASWESLETRLG